MKAGKPNSVVPLSPRSPAQRLCHKIATLAQGIDKTIPAYHLKLFVYPKHFSLARERLTHLFSALSAAEICIRDFHESPRHVEDMPYVQHELRLLQNKLEVAQKKLEELKQKEVTRRPILLNEMQDKLEKVKVNEAQQKIEKVNISQSIHLKNTRMQKLVERRKEIEACQAQEYVALNKKWSKKKSEEKLAQLQNELNLINKAIHEEVQNRDAEEELAELYAQRVMFNEEIKALTRELGFYERAIELAQSDVEYAHERYEKKQSEFNMKCNYAISNEVMFHLLRVYLQFIYLKKSLRGKLTDTMLAAIENGVTETLERDIDDLFHSIWCPHSQDRSGIYFYFSLSEEAKNILVGNQIPDTELIKKIIPQRVGKFFAIHSPTPHQERLSIN